MKKLLLFFLVLVFVKGYSQDKTLADLNDLVSRDSSSVLLLFSYPDSIRNDILIVSTYPQGLVKMEEIQKKSSESFRNVTTKYNRNKQKKLWEITRYPELVALLIKNKDKSKSELKDLLKNYPDDVSKAAIEFVKNDPEMLVEMEGIRTGFEKKYTETVKDFPEEVKKSFSTLLQKPELISILSEDIKTTIMLGNLYKSNPEVVKHAADSLYVEITKANNAELEDWKDGINKDEEVQKELKKIAGKYEKEEQEYTDDVYYSKKYDINIYTIMPYPYWAGYPYWYERPYWYPYPWWYHSGFYWHPGGTIIFGGMPSYYFGWWYYNHPRYHYPRTSEYFHHHYEQHRRSNQGFNKSTKESHPLKKR
ncbi:MAG: hypothetical protein Q8M29_12125 [Bacteroidota bacterium]|nr:hypothetical protein [Bacteroidota bacterium]